MRLPRPADVPVTAALSGVVFVAAYLNLGTPLHLPYILAGWGLVYLGEWCARAVIRPRQERPRPDAATEDPQPDATTGAQR